MSDLGDEAIVGTTSELFELETLEDFIFFNNIRMDVLPIHENPYRLPCDQDSSYHYSCKLINGDDNWFVVYFSKGLGLRLWQSPPDEFEFSGKPLHVPLDKVGTLYDGPLPPFAGENKEWEYMIFNKCSIPSPPTIVEVLNCVANDSFTIEVSWTFENWCSVVGANSDSLHAKRTYETCCDHRLKLLTLLGADKFHYLVHCINRNRVQ